MSRPNNLQRIKALQEQLRYVERNEGKESNQYIRLKTQLDAEMKGLPKYNVNYMRKYGL